MENLKKIFLGEVTNWKELGGKDQKIVILNRAAGSGTRATFEKWVLGDKTAIRAQEQDSSGMVRSMFLIHQERLVIPHFHMLLMK